jgi:AraC-like DNA-binding protein
VSLNSPQLLSNQPMATLSHQTQLDHLRVPAAHAWQMRQWLIDQGHAESAWLKLAQLDRSVLGDGLGHLTVAQCQRLVQAASQLSQDPALGYRLGLSTPLTVHGPLALGLLSSRDGMQALSLLMQFVEQQNPTVALSLEMQSPGLLRLVLTDRMPETPIRPVQLQWVMLAMCLGGLQVLGRTQSAQWSGCTLHWPWPEPAWHAAWATQLPDSHFDAPALACTVPLAWLESTRSGHAPATVAWARQHLQNQTSASSVMECSTPGLLTTQVRQALHDALQQGVNLSLEAVAHRLNRSATSLKRHLQAEHTRFSALQAQVQSEQAKALLAQGSLTIGDIAMRLGFENTANFTRAFKRWTGMPPSQWAQQAPLSGSTPHPRPAPAARSAGAAPSGSTPH